MRQTHWRKAFLFTAMLSASGSSFGQTADNAAAPQTQPPQAAQQPTPTDVKVFGDWVVRCFPVKAPAKCDIFQATIDKPSQKLIVSTSIAYAPGLNGYVAKIVVPLGIKIAAGATITSDAYKSGTLAFTRCENDGCYIEGPLDTALIEKLNGGKTASIVVTLLTGRHVPLPVSLKGFSDAAAAMKTLAIQKG